MVRSLVMGSPRRRDLRLCLGLTILVFSPILFNMSILIKFYRVSKILTAIYHLGACGLGIYLIDSSNRSIITA